MAGKDFAGDVHETAAHATHATTTHAAHAAAHASHHSPAHAATHASTHASAHATTHAAHAHAATHSATHSAAEAAEAAHHVVLDRQDEVGHRVDLGGHELIALGLLRRGDEQHFVVDDVLQLQFVQEQPQGRAERNAPQVLSDRRFGIDAGVFQSGEVELDLDVRRVLEILDDVLQRRLDKLDRWGGILQRLLNLLFLRAGDLEVHRAVFLFAPFRHLLPPLRIGIDDRRFVGGWDVRLLDLEERVDIAFLPRRADRQNVVPGASKRVQLIDAVAIGWAFGKGTFFAISFASSAAFSASLCRDSAMR